MVPASGLVSTWVEAQLARRCVDGSVLGGHARLCCGWGIPNCALTFSRVRLHTVAIDLVSSSVWVLAC